MSIFFALFGLSGLLAGAAGRWWLARLRRGAVFRPPWPELGAALPSALIGWRADEHALPLCWTPVPLVVCWLGVPLVAVDLARRRLPDAITLPAYPLVASALGIAAAGPPGGGLLLRAFVGALAFGGAHGLVRWMAPAGMGAGDVKLAGSLGAVLGALGWAALAAGALGAATVTLLVAAATRSRVVAHGPGLLTATWLLATFPGAGARIG